MKTTDLSEMFPEANGYKTFWGAANKLAKSKAFLEENKVIHTVVVRTDNKFIPVAILGEKNEWCAGPLAGSGICVTRA